MWKKKMENKSGKKHSGSAFLWGVIVGAILATLLTTKKGRAILRELINLGMEMIEDFVDGRKNVSYEKAVSQKEQVIKEEEEEGVAQAAEDLDTDIGETEEITSEDMVETNPAASEIEIDEVSEEAVKFAKKIEEPANPVKRGSKRKTSSILG